MKQGAGRTKQTVDIKRKSCEVGSKGGIRMVKKKLRKITKEVQGRD